MADTGSCPKSLGVGALGMPGYVKSSLDKSHTAFDTISMYALRQNDCFNDSSWEFSAWLIVWVVEEMI